MREESCKALLAINFTLEVLASSFLTTIIVDHYPLFEFACSIAKMFKAIIVALCYVALASPPRHQHLRCFH